MPNVQVDAIARKKNEKYREDSDYILQAIDGVNADINAETERQRIAQDRRARAW
jgi:hypothetical protein